jgi:hypothetical protein
VHVPTSHLLLRFNYSPEFLQWALQPPGYQRDWHVGIRVKSNTGAPGKLVAFISGIPASIRVRGGLCLTASDTFSAQSEDLHFHIPLKLQHVCCALQLFAVGVLLLFAFDRSSIAVISTRHVGIQVKSSNQLCFHQRHPSQHRGAWLHQLQSCGCAFIRAVGVL